MRFKNLLFLLTLLLSTGTITAQPISFSIEEIGVGFFGGTTGYVGDLNGSIIGSGYTINDSLETSNSFLTGNQSLGIHAYYALSQRIEMRGSFKVGSYAYEDKDLDLKFKSIYNTLGLGLMFHSRWGNNLNPYASVGVEAFSFDVPDSTAFTVDDKVGPQIAFSAPVSVGLEIALTRSAALFAEMNYHYVFSNDLDNVAANSNQSGSFFKNDGVLTFNVGLRAQLIEIISIVYPDFSSGSTKAYQPRTIAFENEEPNWPLAAVPSFALPEEDRPKEPVAEAEPEPEPEPEPEVVTPPEPEPIAVVDTENRNFDREEALEKVEELQKKSAEEPEKREPIDERSTLTWDPTVPVILTRPSPIPDDIVENGFTTDFPPDGYYVQVFATVGPISAQRARQMTIDAMEGVLENPEQQTVIVKRDRFYEVRIGVFDTYDDTYEVLKAAQGTFFDSYTLIYIPD